jgi:hypothetical protein
MNNQETFLEAERAIRSVVAKSGIEFAELSPFIRELLASVYIRGGVDALEKLKKQRKEIVEKKPSIL